MRQPLESARRRLVSVFSRLGRRWLVVVGVVLVVLGSFRWWAGALGARVARSQLESRLGVPVSIERGRAGLTRLVLSPVRIGEPGREPILEAARVLVPFSAAWGRGTVVIDGARIHVERGGSNDNVAPVLARLSRRNAGARGTDARPSDTSVPGVEMRAARVVARDHERGVQATVQALDLRAAPGERLSVNARSVSGRLRVRGNDGDPRFGADVVTAEAILAGLRPKGAPSIKVQGGYVQVLPTLGLTGIRGEVQPNGTGSDRSRMAIGLAGSYGGAREVLWTASGQVHPPDGKTPLSMDLSLRAARFSLGKIKDILPPSVLEPQDTTVDASLDLQVREGRLGFKGSVDVSGLSLHHPKVASEPVMKMALGLAFDGALDPGRRRVELTRFEGRLRHLIGRVQGSVELAPGTFTFTDGSTMPMVPKIEMALQVPPLPCAKLLESIPAPIIPHLRGFVMQGTFEANIATKIDYANLDALTLDGKVNIGGCRVKTAPEEVTALAGPDPITQIVEVPSAEKNAPPGAIELMAFQIGGENPDFVPFEKISPHLIASILTTEDGGFFKHRGWVSSEFKTALRKNLAGGGFRLGASSITMQMVKNVLLSREKTLSRKLQELFLVWYIEQQLPKERILELYFNAIEFGPRIYGIGPASRHYFGKPASDLSPLEAAFFSSILPSPKRRYIQYCHGQLFPPWDKYVRRILARVHERGRITDEEYTAANAEPLAFDLTGRPMSEQECMAWVKKITTPAPELDATPEPEN